MRSPIAMVLAASILGLAQSAGAANPSANTKPVSTAPTPAANSPAAKPAVVAPVEDPKHLACEKIWRAQTKHTGKHKAFIAACVAKG